MMVRYPCNLSKNLAYAREFERFNLSLSGYDITAVVEFI